MLAAFNYLLNVLLLIRNNAANLAQIGQEIQNDDYAEIFDYFMPKDDGCIIPILKSCAVKNYA